MGCPHQGRSGGLNAAITSRPLTHRGPHRMDTLRQQFALIAPHLAGLDLLVFDQSGLGDAAAELLPKTPPPVGVCLIGGDRPLTRSTQGDRLVVGKSWLVQRLGAAMRIGEMTVAYKAPGREL